MVELEPTEKSHEIMKSHDTKKVAVQCTDQEIFKGPLPEQVDNKQDDSDSTELAIGAAEDTDPSLWKKEHFTDNIDATVVTIHSNIKSDIEKIKLGLKSAKEKANEVRKLQSNTEVESEVDLENEEVEKENKKIVKNNEKCISDEGTWEKEKHEEENLEKTDKEKETDSTPRKKKRRRYPKSKKKGRKQVSSSSEHVDQPNKEIEVAGILSATGGKQGGVKSASTNTNTTNDNRRHSTRRHPSGGDSLGSISGGGGCGGEPPTPPEEWKQKAPCDGYVEIKRRNRRPSNKRLITRQDSHTSLPSAIRHGSQHVLNQSPENQNNQVFSLPPIGIPAPTDLVIENFVQPAFAHIQAQPSFLKWRTHHCQSCKTMQACFRHVHGCKDQLLCDICRKLFGEVNHHVKLCQRSEEDMCGMDFCKEFYEATEQGKEAQFEILAKFAASFYDTELTDIPYPIQRQQSVSVNGTIGAGNFEFDPNQGILNNNLEDSPTSSDEDSDDDDEEQPSAHDQKADISPPSPGSHGDAPDPRHDTNEQHLSGTANHQPPQRPQSLHQSSSSTSESPSGSAMPTSQSRRGRMPYTEVNKTAVVDHIINKQYKTRHELHLDTAAAQQYAKAPPMWKQEIDEQEEPSVQRGKVVYGEKRHLQAFLLVLDDLQKQLMRNGSAVSEQEEGIIFYMGMKIQNSQYKQGDQYVKVAQLGSGAFGKVYLCKDNKTHFEFVVKMISIEHFSPDEALIWSQMNHPNIVQLLGVIRCGGMIYFFSEYVANMNLKSLVANGRVMGQGEALYHMEQLLNILRYVHSQKVVHRDLKPENILVTADSRLLLIDWGLAKMVRGEYLESEQNPEGTQHYMAPEVAKCEAYNFAADIWSIMCIGIHLISGLPPWMKRFGSVPLLFYVIGTKSPPLEDIPEDTNEQVRDLLVRGLTVEPEQRPSAMVLLEHPALALAHELQNVEAVSPKQKIEQQLELEMAKIADAPSDGEWRPQFAAADDDVDINLPCFGGLPFFGLTTPDETGGPPNLECQDVLGSAAEDPAGGDYACKQQNTDMQRSGSGFMQQSDLKSSEAAPAFTAPTEFVPPELEITPGGEGSLQVQQEPVIAFRAPSFSLEDPGIESQQPGGGIRMPEYDFSRLAIIRPPQSLSHVEEEQAGENDDQESLGDSNISQEIKDIPQKEKQQSMAEIPHSSTFQYSTSFEGKEQPSFEAEQKQVTPKASTNPETISIASSVANSTRSSSPAVNDVPSTTTPDDVKQFPQQHHEDGNPSAGASNTPMRHSGTMSSHQSHSATSTRFPTLHHAYHEEQLSYGSIHSSVDLYGPSPDVTINQDFPPASHAPSQAHVKGQPEQEVLLDVQPGPNQSSLTEVSTSASEMRVEVVHETEAVYGDSKSGTASAIEVLQQMDKMTVDDEMEEDIFAAVTLGSATTMSLAFNTHAEMGRTTATSTASETTSIVHQVVQSSSMGHSNSQNIGVADPTHYKEDVSECEQNPVEVKIPMDVAATETITSTDLLISKESNPSISMESSSPLSKQQGESVIPSAQQMVSEDPQTTRQVQPPSTLDLSSVLKTSSKDLQISNVQTKASSEIDPASPPKMLREDQPSAAYPPPQSAILGNPYEPSSMCSQTSSDMSLRQSLSRRQMPFCKLAPVFSEACGLCEEEPLNNLHQTNPEGSSQTTQPEVKVVARADSPTRASSTEYNQLLGAVATQDHDRLPDGSTPAKETSSESDPSGSQGSQLNGACNSPPPTSTTKTTSSDSSSRDDVFQDAPAMPLSATDGRQAMETNVDNVDMDKELGGACNFASSSGAGQLSADPEATKQTSPKDARGGDIVQFLTDDDEWRFSMQTQGISGCMLGASTPITHNRPIVENTPSDDAYRPSSYPSFEQAASNVSADELYMQFAANNLMQQACCAESVEDQLCLMNEALEMDSSFHTASASLSLEKIGTPGQMTSGVYSAQGPSPTYEVTKSIATLQQQLSTVSSSSSISNGGTKVTVVIDSNQENHISIRMGRDQTIKDLAVGIRTKVPIGIETFTLKAIDDRALCEREAIGSDDLMFVIVPDPPDNTWTWRVRRGCGTLEYPDSLLG